MVIDSSVLISILLKEPEAVSFTQTLLEAESLYLSAVTLVEVSMVAQSRAGLKGLSVLNTFIAKLNPDIIPFDVSQAQQAILAWQRYGKGNHPAKLKFGDCCAYALAKSFDQPLLYKGKDFSLTDVIPASFDLRRREISSESELG